VEGPRGGTEGEDRLDKRLPDANPARPGHPGVSCVRRFRAGRGAAGAFWAGILGGVNVQIRDAIVSDAGAIAPLIEQLVRRPTTAEQVAARLRRLETTGGDRVLCAVYDGRVMGVAAVTYAWLLHADAPTARLMTLVVDEAGRGRGIGRRLVEASVDQARAWGCDRLELTSRLERAGAHTFYEAVGFAHTSKKFQMAIPPLSPAGGVPPETASRVAPERRNGASPGAPEPTPRGADATPSA